MLENITKNTLFKHLETIKYGTLTLTTPDGKTRVFQGGHHGETADLTLHNWRVVRNVMQKGDIGFAEDYRDGHWETSDLTALLSLSLRNKQAFDRLVMGNAVSRILAMLSYLFRSNTIKGSRQNIHAHYDLGNEFYKLWLDPSMTYSSAIFKKKTDTLEQAQQNKYDRILNCLDQNSGRILEVGCGWGGFCNRAQERGDYTLKGITLSNEQHAYASQKLGTSANIALEDYRHQEGRFDNIVSIEMFEAVGERYWPTYFSKIGSLLSKKGKAIIQTITINDQSFETYRRGGDFIRSYIFPGGMLPSPRRFKEEVENVGLTSQNTFFFGQDYARTLQQWLETFDAKQEAVLALGFDKAFSRLWRFYLAACIAGFKTEHTNVMQVELSHV